jgi:hypothetical protein
MRLTKWTNLVLGCFILAGAASASAQVVVQLRPPRDVVERRSAPPGPGYVWVQGYQRWDGHGYVWVPGEWQRPPREHARWERHRWVKHGRDWEFREGHWR